jgi:hypothetical protein
MRETLAQQIRGVAGLSDNLDPGECQVFRVS